MREVLSLHLTEHEIQSAQAISDHHGPILVQYQEICWRARLALNTYKRGSAMMIMIRIAMTATNGHVRHHGYSLDKLKPRYGS